MFFSMPIFVLPAAPWTISMAASALSDAPSCAQPTRRDHCVEERQRHRHAHATENFATGEVLLGDEHGCSIVLEILVSDYSAARASSTGARPFWNAALLMTPLTNVDIL